MTRLPIRVAVEPEGRAQVSPATAVVLVGSSCDTGPSYQTCCDVLNFFEDEGSAKAYLGTHREVTAAALPIPDAVRLANAIFGKLLAGD